MFTKGNKHLLAHQRPKEAICFPRSPSSCLLMADCYLNTDIIFFALCHLHPELGSRMLHREWQLEGPWQCLVTAHDYL